MGERIRILRKKLGLNQTEFGNKLGIKQTTVAGYESGARSPLDTVISSICKEYNVNEKWLRTGQGEMFVELSRDEQISKFAGEILKSEEDSFKKRFISMLAALDESGWESLQKMVELLQKKEGLD